MDGYLPLDPAVGLGYNDDAAAKCDILRGIDMSETPTIGRSRKKHTKLMVAAVGLVMLVLAGVLLCRFLGIRSGQDLMAYRAMTGEHFHPVWKDLALRRIRKGDDLAETIRRHPPLSREDFESYTVLFYSASGVLNNLQITAANGVLIDARATSCTWWKHVFFESPMHERAFSRAWSQHMEQKLLEIDADLIHRVILARQDVFIARQVKRREVADDPNSAYSQEMIRQYEELYGRNYAKQMGFRALMRTELTVEVSNVLHGDLKPGVMLTFFDEECSEADLAEPQTVFLHVEDSRTIHPHSEGGELYLTVPGKALEWYESLTPDQIKDFEARCLARMTQP